MIAAKYSSPTVPKVSRKLALGAVAGPVLFTLAWLILGLISPGYPLWDLWIAPYSPISQPVSGLGLGETGPFMNAAFVLTGILMIAGAAGIFGSVPGLSAATRRAGTVILAIPGTGAIMDGLFTLESFLLHFVGFALVLTTIASFPIVGLLLRQVPSWQRVGRWLLLAGPLTLVLAVVYFATFDQEAAGANLGVAGLTQRILLLEIFAWYVLMGWKAFKQPSLVDSSGSGRSKA